MKQRTIFAGAHGMDIGGKISLQKTSFSKQKVLASLSIFDFV
jgi:hypothetical protein